MIVMVSLFCSCKKSLTSLYEITETVTVSKKGDTCQLASIRSEEHTSELQSH